MHDDDEDGDEEKVGDDDDGDDHLEKVELLPHDGVHLLSDLVLHLQPLLTPEKHIFTIMVSSVTCLLFGDTFPLPPHHHQEC